MPENISAKRKKIEAYVLDIIQTAEPSGANTERYKAFFASMDDKAFDAWIEALRSGKARIDLVTPNQKVVLKSANIIAAAKKVGVELFERLRLYDEKTGMYYITPQKYFVARLPVRRVKQFLMDKISVPESDTKTDLLTGQVLKPDKGSSISLVEAQIIHAKGLDKSLVELMGVRGGNAAAYAALKGSIASTGQAELNAVVTDSPSRSAVVASVYLRCMHIDNNLVEGM